ncbi:MAG TPA: hypothetical protein ACFYEK_05900 [Candidatus Wunengus sp. YC60]|uniref:hypothetical protein n=1 Tax=Candidatus Wunengus sp. YC60 TaxID=3367697 RepID=UPI00402A2B2D
MTTQSSNTAYEKLPLIDLKAPKVLSRRNRAENIPSESSILQDSEDAKTILTFAGFDGNLSPKSIMGVTEKYMIETQPPNAATRSPESSNSDMRQKGIRKPHYTRLLVFGQKLVFQAACCLPLKVIAASLGGNAVSGRVLFNSHSEECGGKLVYEFDGKGTEMIIDLKRGESTRAQRLIFLGIT